MMYPALWDDATEQRVMDAGENRDDQGEIRKTIKFCTRCVTSNQRPRITFDKDGVCSACRYAEKKWGDGIDWKARRRELTKLLNRFRTSSTYDVVVPSSGGKDSAHVAVELKDCHRMTPLCALWEPHMYTDRGRENQDAFTHHGFDTIKCQPNGLTHRKLARLAFEFYGDPFMPFVYGQLAWPLHVAVNNGIGWVMYGENGEAEYGGDAAAAEKMFWDFDDWDRVYNKGVRIDDLVAIGDELGCFTKSEKRTISAFYKLPRREILDQFSMTVSWFSYFEPWHPMENYYAAVEHTGFEPNEERSEGTYSRFASLDDKLDGLHYYMGYIKFGIGRCTSDAAQQVRAGDLSRDEAVDLVRRYDGEVPARHMLTAMTYLNMSQEHLKAVVDRFRQPHIWEDLGEGDWRLKKAVYHGS